VTKNIREVKEADEKPL